MGNNMCYNDKVLSDTTIYQFSQIQYKNLIQNINYKTLLDHLKHKYKQYLLNSQFNHQQDQSDDYSGLQIIIRNIFTSLIQENLIKVNTNQTTIKKCKLQIAKKMLQVLIQIIKWVIINDKKNGQKSALIIFQRIQQFTKNLCSYLKTKYPRSQNLQAGQLGKQFKQYDWTGKFQYDMIANANIVFKPVKQKMLTKEERQKLEFQQNKKQKVELIINFSQKLIKNRQFQQKNKTQQNLKQSSKSINQNQNNKSKLLKSQETIHDFDIKNTIKVFFNRIMDQIDKNFNKFQNLMLSIDPNFKVGRKISQNTARYTKLDTPEVQASSPQIARVLIKWAESLSLATQKSQQFFSNQQNQIKITKLDQYNNYLTVRQLNSSKYKQQQSSINQNSSDSLKTSKVKQSVKFSCNNSCVKNQYIQNPRAKEKKVQHKKQTLISVKCDQKQYSQLINENDDKNIIRQINKNYEKNNENSKENKDYFNKCSVDICRDLYYSYINQKQISTSEMEIIKYSASASNLISWTVQEKLVDSIKILVDNAQKHPFDIGMPNFIKFNVNDLLRCQLFGNKQIIKNVFTKLQKKHQKNQISIVKVKNRFATLMSDAIICFKIPQSFIICQCQLVLTQNKNTDQAKRTKNFEQLNHFLYELERSPFGIFGELSLFLKNQSDTVNSYENKLKLQLKQQRKNQIIRIIKNNQSNNKKDKKPFMCSYCFIFYEQYENYLKTICKINQSSIQICMHCKQAIQMLNQYKQRQDAHKNQIMSKIKIYIGLRLQYLSQQQKLKINNFFTKNVQFLPQKLWKKNHQERGLLKQKQNIYRVQKLMNIIGKIDSQAIRKGWQIHFILYQQFGQKIRLTLYCYDQKQKVIQNVYNRLQKYLRHQSIKLYQTSQIFILNNQNKTVRAKFYKNMVQKLRLKINNYPSSNKIQIDNKINEFIKSIQKEGFSKQINDSKNFTLLFIFNYYNNLQVQKLKQNLVSQVHKKNIITTQVGDYFINFEIYNKRPNYIKKQLQMQPKSNSINLKNQKIIDQEIYQFYSKTRSHKHLFNWLQDVTTLNLSGNFLESIQIIFKIFHNLQKLDISNNQVNKITFSNKLFDRNFFNIFEGKKSNLKELNISNNYITELINFQTVNNLQIFNCRSNGLNQFPNMSSFKNLRSIDFSYNLLKTNWNLLSENLNQIILDQIGLKDKQMELFFAQQSKKLASIQNLSFKENNITQLPTMKNLQKFVSLKNFSLDMNNIKIVSNDENKALQKFCKICQQVKFKLPINSNILKNRQIYEFLIIKIKQLSNKDEKYRFIGFNGQIKDKIKQEQIFNFFEFKPKTMISNSEQFSKNRRKEMQNNLIQYLHKSGKYLFFFRVYEIQNENEIQNYYYKDNKFAEYYSLNVINRKNQLQLKQQISYSSYSIIDQLSRFVWQQLIIINFKGQNINDNDWSRLVENSNKFTNLRTIYMINNEIKNIKQSDILSFKQLSLIQLWSKQLENKQNLQNQQTLQNLQNLQNLLQNLQIQQNKQKIKNIQNKQRKQNKCCLSQKSKKVIKQFNKQYNKQNPSKWIIHNKNDYQRYQQYLKSNKQTLHELYKYQ